MISSRLKSSWPAAVVVVTAAAVEMEVAAATVDFPRISLRRYLLGLYATTCPACSSSKLVQESDVLDTWFSSALWPLSTMGWPDASTASSLRPPTSCGRSHLACGWSSA